MSTTHEDRFYPYRESAGSKPLRPGGAEADEVTELDPGFNLLFVGLAIVLAIGIVIGLFQIGRVPAEPEQLSPRTPEQLNPQTPGQLNPRTLPQLGPRTPPEQQAPLELELEPAPSLPQTTEL